MNCYNLKKNKCPQCNKDFLIGMTVRSNIFHHKCGFVISELRYKEITMSMNADDVIKNLQAEFEETN